MLVKTSANQPKKPAAMLGIPGKKLRVGFRASKRSIMPCAA